MVASRVSRVGGPLTTRKQSPTTKLAAMDTIDRWI